MRWPKNKCANGPGDTLWRLAAAGPVVFAREFLKFDPYEAQERVMRAIPQYKEIVLNCSRQWGKSTLIAAMLVHRMLTEGGVLILVATPGARQSGQLVEKVKRFLDVLGLRYGRYAKHEHSALLPNGSAIVGLPAADRKIRGFSAVSVLVFDEAAWVPDDLFYALLPTLATTNGDLFVLGTPFEKRGFFYRMMTEDAPGRFRYTGPVTECPRVSAEFLEGERRRGEAFYLREYMCVFIETGKFLLTADAVKRAFDNREVAWVL